MTAGDKGNKAELLRQLFGEDQGGEAASSVAARADAGRLQYGYLWAAVLAGAAVALIFALKTSSPPASQPSSVVTAPAAGAPTLAARERRGRPADETRAILNASGHIIARRMATVSSQVMGVVQAVLVEEGMAVEAQQMLAQLDDRKAKIDLRLAQAQARDQRQRVNSVLADLTEAERTQARLLQLADNFASEAQRTRASAAVERLRANLASAQAQLNASHLSVSRARNVLADHLIRAPFAGVITAKNAQPGEVVAPASGGGGFTRTGICTLVDMSSLEIEVEVNEAYIGRVAAGQKVIANLDAYPDWGIQASVLTIIPTANRAKATVQVRIRITQPDPRILPNMGVKVAFFAQPYSTH